MSILEKINLLPMQSTVLTFLSLITCILFVILTIAFIFVVGLKKTTLKKKLTTYIFRFFLVFVLSFLITIALGASFLTDVEFGLGPSILTGISTVVCLVSLGLCLKGLLDSSIQKKYKRWEYICWWCYLSLALISYAILLTAVIMSLSKIQG